MTPDEIRHLAVLARLRLTEPEAERMASDMESIFSHMAVLRRVAPENAEAGTGAAETSAPLRPDRVDFDPLMRPAEEVAPAWADGFFVVPRLPALDADGSGGEDG